jgi:hypothetical protein
VLARNRADDEAADRVFRVTASRRRVRVGCTNSAAYRIRPIAGTSNKCTPRAIAALADGLSKVLRVYARLGFQSFNLAIHDTGTEGAAVVLPVVGRAYFGPLQRSDVMWSERLHGEATTDLEPERVAELAARWWDRVCRGRSVG